MTTYSHAHTALTAGGLSLIGACDLRYCDKLIILFIGIDILLIKLIKRLSG